MLKAQVAAPPPRIESIRVICVGCDEMRGRQGHPSVSVFRERMGQRARIAVPDKDPRVWAIFMDEPGWRNGIRRRGRSQKRK